MSDWVYGILAVICLTAVCKVVYLTARGSRTASSAGAQPGPVRQPWTTAGRDQNESGPVVYYANDRRSGADRKYCFNYKRVYDPGFGCYCWRAYILRMPSLGGRDPDLHKTHRFTNGAGQYWVCWDRAVETMKDVQAISRVWADSIQEYIATGKRFG